MEGRKKVEEMEWGGGGRDILMSGLEKGEQY